MFAGGQHLVDRPRARCVPGHSEPNRLLLSCPNVESFSRRYVAPPPPPGPNVPKISGDEFHDVTHSRRVNWWAIPSMMASTTTGDPSGGARVTSMRSPKTHGTAPSEQVGDVGKRHELDARWAHCRQKKFCTRHCAIANASLSLAYNSRTGAQSCASKRRWTSGRSPAAG